MDLVDRTRYDGMADWYDSWARPSAESSRTELLSLMGPGEGFPAVAAFWISTDVDDFRAVMREAARVLAPGGMLLFYGVHPCFNGPCVEVGGDGARIVHPTYRMAGWHESSPWWGTEGIRCRVGMRHVHLPELLSAFLDSGLSIQRVVEPRDEPVPFILAIIAQRLLSGT